MKLFQFLNEVYNELILNRRKVDNIYFIGEDVHWLNREKKLVSIDDIRKDKVNRRYIFIEQDLKSGVFRSYFPKTLIKSGKYVHGIVLKVHDELPVGLADGYIRQIIKTNYI